MTWTTIFLSDTALVAGALILGLLAILFFRKKVQKRYIDLENYEELLDDIPDDATRDFIRRYAEVYHKSNYQFVVWALAASTWITLFALALVQVATELI